MVSGHRGLPAGGEPRRLDRGASANHGRPTSRGEVVARGARCVEDPQILVSSPAGSARTRSRAGGIVDDAPASASRWITRRRPTYRSDFFRDVPDQERESVVVHELAHQWVGDSVSVARWQDIWLNEGFATYAEWLWSEHTGGRTPEEWFAFVESVFPADDPFWLVRIGDPGPEQLFDASVYYRGAMTLQALRRAIGDKAFFQVLRSWTCEHANGNVRTADFIALAERESGRNLTTLFDTWLYTAGQPTPGAAARQVAGSRAPSGRSPLITARR